MPEDMPFYVIARLLREVFRVGDLDDVAARGRIRARLASADPEDVQLLEELLGVGDSGAAAIKFPRTRAVDDSPAW